LAPLREAVELSYLAPSHFDGIGIGPRGLAGISAHGLLGFLEGLSPLRILSRLHVLILKMRCFRRPHIRASVDRPVTWWPEKLDRHGARSAM
jgi:hypothetical protein